MGGTPGYTYDVSLGVPINRDRPPYPPNSVRMCAVQDAMVTQERVVSLLEQGLTGDAQPPQERQQLMVVGARVALADMCGLAGQHKRRKLVLQQAVEEVRRLHGRGVEDHSDFLRASLQLAACHATLGEWQEVRGNPRGRQTLV